MKIFICAAPVLLFAASAFAGAGLPNPASTKCLDLGGKLMSYEKGNEGTISLCAFQDAEYLNGMIEEWTLFYDKTRETKERSMAIEAFFAHVPYQAPPHGSPVGHPALRYCLQLGGTRDIITASTGDESGVCVFADGSQIEEWTLFRGPDVHKRLSAALQ